MLAAVNAVCAEDTRNSGALLAHFSMTERDVDHGVHAGECVGVDRPALGVPLDLGRIGGWPAHGRLGPRQRGWWPSKAV